MTTWNDNDSPYDAQSDFTPKEGDKMGCLNGEIKVYNNGKWKHWGYEDKLKDDVEAFRKLLADLLYTPSRASKAAKTFTEAISGPYLGFATINKKEK